MDTIPQPDVEYIQTGTTVIDGAVCRVGATLRPYTYRPLTRPNEIRLLCLQPREKVLQTTDGIVPLCSLEHVVLGEEHDPYLAMSYSWGDLNHYRTINLPGNTYINVTESLFTMLCHLTPMDERVVIIWADQVCINQRDHAERSIQVKMMNEIYEQATGTTVWLGEGDDTVGSAETLMQKLNCEELSLLEVVRLESQRKPEELKRVLQRNKIELDDREPGWAAIRRIGEMPWFSRIWTFQEAVVGKYLMFLCGQYIFWMEDIDRAFRIVEQLKITGARSKGWYNTCIMMLHRHHYRHSRVHLMDLLRDTCNGTYHCTDPRDAIYALIALQNQHTRCSIEVDYTLPTFDVYVQAANAITASKNGLDILYRPRRYFAARLPTWVPSFFYDRFNDAINDDAPQTLFDCSNGSKHVFEDAPFGRLITKGKQVARVREIAEHSFADIPFTRDYEGLKIYIGLTTLVPQLIAKLKGCAACENLSASETEGYLNWLISMTLSRGWYRNRDFNEFKTSGDHPRSDLAALLVSDDDFGVYQMCKCELRKIGLLDSLAFPIALIPDNALANDLVCVLNGANVPIVLRESGEYFEFVGDCFVHGIMYGEAINWSQDDCDTFQLI